MLATASSNARVIHPKDPEPATGAHIPWPQPFKLEQMNRTAMMNKPEVASCVPVFDIVFVQDVTDSLNKIVDGVRTMMPEFFRKIEEKYPSSFIGVAFFQDKPHDVGDTCFGTMAPLSNSVDKAVEVLANIKPSGGWDWRENQLGAMMRAALTPKIGWRDLAAPGVAYGRIEILVTDSVSHKGEKRQWQEIITNEGLPYTVEYKQTRLGKVDDFLIDDENIGCETDEYPTWMEWGRVLAQRNITPLVLVAPSPDVGDLWDEATDVGQPEGVWNPPDDMFGLESYYRFYGSNPGGLNVRVASFDEEMTNLLDNAMKLVDDIANEVCSETCPPA